jgi:hypothetical protein
MAFPQIRWLEALQNDFAARAKWCINDYKNANHSPIVKILSSNNLLAKPNGIVKLNALATDPDGNKLTYKWWQYEEVGTYKGKIDLKNADLKNANFAMPNNINKGETIHIILEVTDNGLPQMTRYQRVVVKAF